MTVEFQMTYLWACLIFLLSDSAVEPALVKSTSIFQNSEAFGLFKNFPVIINFLVLFVSFICIDYLHNGPLNLFLGNSCTSISSRAVPEVQFLGSFVGLCTHTFEKQWPLGLCTPIPHQTFSCAQLTILGCLKHFLGSCFLQVCPGISRTAGFVE